MLFHQLLGLTSGQEFVLGIFIQEPIPSEPGASLEHVQKSKMIRGVVRGDTPHFFRHARASVPGGLGLGIFLRPSVSGGDGEMVKWKPATPYGTVLQYHRQIKYKAAF